MAAAKGQPVIVEGLDPRGFVDLARGALIVLGVLAAVLGVVVLVVPHKTLWLVAVIFGIYFILAGLGRLVGAIVGSLLPGGVRAVLGVLGALLIASGVFIVFNPHVGAITIGLLAGIAWILDGIGAISSIPPGTPKGLQITFGVITIIAGIVILFVPVTAALVFVIVGGVALLVVGLFAIGAGIVLGRKAKQLIA